MFDFIRNAAGLNTETKAGEVQIARREERQVNEIERLQIIALKAPMVETPPHRTRTLEARRRRRTRLANRR